MRFFCSLLVFICLFNCSKPKTERKQLTDFIPENSKIAIKIANIESLKSSLQNNNLIEILSKTDSYTILSKKLAPLSHITTNTDLLLCFSKEDDSIQYTAITKLNKNTFNLDTLKHYTEEKRTYKNKTIIKSQLEDIIFYNTVIDSTLIISSSKTIIDNIYNPKATKTTLKGFSASTNTNETLSIAIDSKDSFFTSFFIEPSLASDKLFDRAILDAEIDQNSMYLNGVVRSTDSTLKIIDIFKNTIAQENKIQHITPANSNGFLSFTFDDIDTFHDNLSHYKKADTTYKTPTLFSDINEIGIIYQGNQQAVVLNSADIIATEDALLGEQNKIETYRDLRIYNYSRPELFAETFSPLISYDNASKYCLIDTFFIFSDSIDLLRNIIANYQNKTTLSERDDYQNTLPYLSDESSLLFVMTPELLNTVITKNLNQEHDLKLDNYNLSAVQFIYDNHFAHMNAIVKKSKKKVKQNSVSEELNITLESDLLNPPQFVTNHTTKAKEILVQDINNHLYLISNKGKTLWKKALNNPVLGKVEQIDIYRNGRLQLAFATPNKIYVLDRHGNDVAPFPITLNDKITQPLSVFDYDNNKKYRLLVTQNHQVTMFDTKAKIVKGFKFKSAHTTIENQPKHFRIGTKDYVTLKTKNKLYILNRRGKERVTPKSTYPYSSAPVFQYKNKFTTTTSNGNLVSTDTKGNISKTNLNLTSNHYIDATSKTLVTLTNNKLTIKSKSIDLDYGTYTPPKIFYINNKIYVSVTDIQAKKVYLFDSQCKLLPNFPVYGNSAISLDNIDHDKNLELVTKGDNNSILLYQIN